MMTNLFQTVHIRMAKKENNRGTADELQKMMGEMNNLSVRRPKSVVKIVGSQTSVRLDGPSRVSFENCEPVLSHIKFQYWLLCQIRLDQIRLGIGMVPINSRRRLLTLPFFEAFGGRYHLLQVASSARPTLYISLFRLQ